MPLATMQLLSGLSVLQYVQTGIALPLLALALYLTVNEIVRNRARNPAFYGPPGLPIIGNIRDIRFHAPSQFQQWAKQYGDVYQIQLGNQPILVVNSAAAAKEIFQHNAHAVSSRPTFYTFHKIVAKTAGATIGTSPLSDDLKRRRRAAASALNKPSVNSYVSYLHVETLAFIKDCLKHGELGKKAIYPLPLIQRFALSVVLTVNWGTRFASSDDTLFREIIEVEGGIVKTRGTTQNFQDYIPLLRLNPFSYDSTTAADWRRRRDVYLDKLDSELRHKMEQRSHRPCIQANCILDPETKLTKQDLTTISISLIQGGTDTVSGTLIWSIAMLAKRPDIQQKAWEEIRKIHKGQDAILCDGTDEHQCEYMNALVKECLRYFTVLRLALPRATIQDISYQGRLIPAGSTIFLNAWACNMDKQIWKDPHIFRPERWLQQPDAPLFTYGLGYRMCAGSTLANRELYLLLMRTISCFEILNAGPDLDVDPVTGADNPREAGRRPRRYEAYFKPRNARVLKAAIEKQEEGLGFGPQRRTTV